MAAAFDYDTPINTGFLDAGEERSKMLAPLRGYASKPLLSLQDAVEPLSRLNLLVDVESRVWISMNNSRDPTDDLSQNESAAIHLYTFEWDPDHRSLYSVLNETLRLENRHKLRPWFLYLKLILTALYKLPSVRATVWRGVRADLRSKYKKNDFVTWWAFSLCTTSIEVLQLDQYLGTSGTRTLFSIECFNGKAIRPHSYFEKEDEILLLPCSHFQVLSQLSQEGGLHIIHLREVKPPHLLLEPPFNTTTAADLPIEHKTNTDAAATSKAPDKKIQAPACSRQKKLEQQRRRHQALHLLTNVSGLFRSLRVLDRPHIVMVVIQQMTQFTAYIDEKNKQYTELIKNMYVIELKTSKMESELAATQSILCDVLEYLDTLFHLDGAPLSIRRNRQELNSSVNR